MAATQTEGKITALYERLSRDDDIVGDSSSIANQKTYLEAYAAQQGFTNCVHYTDDGYSGVNFDRPGWNRMIDDMEAGKIGVVLVKDMSRIGRNYLSTGFYTEEVFRKLGVRFIAVSNGIDSNDPSTNEFAPMPSGMFPGQHPQLNPCREGTCSMYETAKLHRFLPCALISLRGHCPDP
ncbi:MAG: hypothetical protein E7318_09645 [Clostridiales bacterium]|nr:hypothetical protein [Clostridiales bacterium]